MKPFAQFLGWLMAIGLGLGIVLSMPWLVNITLLIGVSMAVLLAVGYLYDRRQSRQEQEVTAPLHIAMNLPVDARRAMLYMALCGNKGFLPDDPARKAANVATMFQAPHWADIQTLAKQGLLRGPDISGRYYLADKALVAEVLYHLRTNNPTLALERVPRRTGTSPRRK